MAEFDLYPTSDIDTPWEGGTHWSQINEDKDSPDGVYIEAQDDDDNEEEIFHVQNLNNVYKVTTVQARVYARNSGGDTDMIIGWGLNGSWEDRGTPNIGNSWDWETRSYSGKSLDQDDCNNITLHLWSESIPKDVELRVDIGLIHIIYEPLVVDRPIYAQVGVGFFE